MGQCIFGAVASFGFSEGGASSRRTPLMTFRHCRTTFATLYGGDPRDRQAILGHYCEEFNRRVYRKPILDRQKASVNALEARLTGKVVTMPVRKSA
jgi:hypothetical protein